MGFKYNHFPTVSENLVSMMAHLGKMGQRPAAKAE